MINVNLLPKERRLALVRRRRGRAWMIGGTGYAGLIVVAGLVFSLSGPRAAVATDLYERQQRELAERSSRVDDLTARAAVLTKQLDRLNRIQGHPDVNALVRVVASQLGDRLILDSIAMERIVQAAKEPARGRIGADAKPAAAAQSSSYFQIDIAGLAKDQPDVTSFVLRLEQLGLFDKVTVLESGKKDVHGAELTHFRIRCRADQAAAPGKGGGT
jgi:Tfp pilus assembly protein PilN